MLCLRCRQIAGFELCIDASRFATGTFLLTMALAALIIAYVNYVYAVTTIVCRIESLS